MLKPEPETYHELVKKYNLIPSETLFIDDLLPNIEEAAKEGFLTIFLPDHAMLREELLSILPGVKL